MSWRKFLDDSAQSLVIFKVDLLPNRRVCSIPRGGVIYIQYFHARTKIELDQVCANEP
jgi:hypothetical protein